MATLPGVSLAINDCTLDDVPDLPWLLTMHRALGLGWIGARHWVTSVVDDALAEITPDPSAADTGPAQAAGMLHLTAAMNHARQTAPERSITISVTLAS